MRILRRPEALAKVGLAKTQLYEQMAEGTFTRPVKLGGVKSVRWIESELEDWIAKRIAERDGGRR